MKKSAYILMIVATVFFAFLIVPLAWMVPMTLQTKRAQTDGQKHIALGICTILFALWPFGLIAGIFDFFD